MFRLWAKEWKENHLIRDTVICDDSNETRTHKVFRALDEVCKEFDLAVPVWLDVNVRDFKRQAKTKFTQDNFIEELEFDQLEIMIIEDD